MSANALLGTRRARPRGGIRVRGAAGGVVVTLLLVAALLFLFCVLLFVLGVAWKLW